MDAAYNNFEGWHVDDVKVFDAVGTRSASVAARPAGAAAGSLDGSSSLSAAALALLASATGPTFQFSDPLSSAPAADAGLARMNLSRPASAPLDATNVSAASAAAPSESPAIIPGELLISFKPGMSLTDIGHFYAEHGFSEKEALDHYARANTSRLKLVSVPAARTTELISVLERDPRVAYAEPNYLFTNVSTALTPTDPFFVGQWHLNNTGQYNAVSTPDADIDAVDLELDRPGRCPARDADRGREGYTLAEDRHVG